MTTTVKFGYYDTSTDREKIVVKANYRCSGISVFCSYKVFLVHLTHSVALFTLSINSI